MLACISLIFMPLSIRNKEEKEKEEKEKVNEVEEQS
jgi:hypothetical protein